MKNNLSHQKTSRRSTNAAAQRASAGPGGIAIAPPQNRTGLPDELKAGVESLSGISLDDVRVHYNSSKPAALQALAYTQGTDIHVAPGQERHLPHEAWHVVQQAQRRVQPTIQLEDGININDNAGLEKEADEMGTRAVQMKHQREWHPFARVVQQKQGLIKPAMQMKIRVANSLGKASVVQFAWHIVQGQNGQFEGNEAYHHLHRVGGNEHYRYGNGQHRYYYMHRGRVNYDGLVQAIAACQTDQQPHNEGQAECLHYLQDLLAKTPKPKAPVKEEKKSPPPPPPKSGGGSSGKVGGKSAKYWEERGAALAERAKEIF